MVMSSNSKNYEENKDKEIMLKLLNSIKKYNSDSNIQIKLNNIEKRIKDN